VGFAFRVPPARSGPRSRALRQRWQKYRAGAGQANLDLSLFRTWQSGESLRCQLRLEAFNVLNHANFGVPINDLVSPNFGRIVDAGPPRVWQAALKLLF